MTLQPPGTPPGSPRRRGATGEGEARLLNILARLSGRVSRKRLYSASGLSASEFNFWLQHMEDQGIVERLDEDGEDLVVLRRG